MRAFGIPVYVQGDFAIGVALIAFSSVSGGGSLLEGLIAAAMIFGSVLLHEYGHALAARQCGVRTTHISLGLLGGVANLSGRIRRNSHDAWITIAGPLVNVVLWLVGSALIWHGLRPDGWFLDAPRSAFWLLSIATINKWLLLFNLIPAWPMDGGRLLVCGLRLFWSEAKSHYIASYVAQVAAVGLVLWGIWRYNNGGSLPILTCFIAYFVWTSAAALRARLSSQRFQD
jgi:Zn-dependent protease